MITVNFYLKSVKPNKKGEVPIIAQVANDYKKIRKQIGKNKPKNWNKKNQRLRLPDKDESTYEEFASFNQLLDSLQNEIRDLSNRTILEKKAASEAEIRQILNLNIDKQTSKPPLDFFDLFDEYIEIQKAIRALNTIKGIVTIRNFLFYFQRDTNFQITFDKIDMHFGDKLSSYCFNDKEIDNDYYIKIINVLKMFYRWAGSRGYHQGEFPDILNGIREKENDVIFLTLEELNILYNYNFESERLRRVRDMYCLSCFTGLRHSDLYTLEHAHINDEMITKTQKKTQSHINIPLNKQAKAILDRYKDQPTPLHRISNQKSNDYLKECLKLIAKDQKPNKLFNRKIIKRKMVGHQVKETAIPLYKGITFHTGRKTFITNSLILGLNLQALQKMGAPKKQKDLAKYLKITDAYMNQQMKDTWDKID